MTPRAIREGLLWALSLAVIPALCPHVAPLARDAAQVAVLLIVGALWVLHLGARRAVA